MAVEFRRFGRILKLLLRLLMPSLHPQQYLDPASAEYVDLDWLVPENLVCGLIRRFGANISRIRNEFGANIKVQGGRGEQTQANPFRW
ncbi:uncharacterized protein [Primulina eburnea]|uniref:uncharacterized protein isoform X2 n=1 Tax=Primulina eburnea TaxID=1245227 RepID=UPI003C6C7C20